MHNMPTTSLTRLGPRRSCGSCRILMSPTRPPVFSAVFRAPEGLRGFEESRTQGKRFERDFDLSLFVHPSSFVLLFSSC